MEGIKPNLNVLISTMSKINDVPKDLIADLDKLNQQIGVDPSKINRKLVEEIIAKYQNAKDSK